ncbi:MAG: hypothetical protein ACP5DX_04015 [Paracoccaceae bacterium]
MKKPRHPVTDHAVVRYLERIEGMDIEALRRKIGRQVDRAVNMGACAVVIDGYQYRIVEGTVVTVVRHNMPNIRTGRCGGKGGADAD